MGLDLWELELRVVWVHGHQLFASRRAQNLDDLDQLVHAALAWEDRLSEDELGRHAGGGPDVDDRGVVRRPEDELRGAVVPRADVRHVGLPPHQPLGGAKVAELERVRPPVHEEVLRLDVPVADPHCVDVGAGPAHLVGVELNKDVRHRLLHLIVVLHDAVDRIRAILHHDIEVRLAGLVAGGVEGVLQLHDVGVPELLHYLQLAVLVALVLEDLLDCHGLTSFDHLGLVDNAEGATAQDTLCIVSERRLLGGVACVAVGVRLSTFREPHAVEVRLHGPYVS
mmetsp:Transcript_104835/g.254445  ORF Transcript_104835/g.254445 Transcript_104835/m.254445 type:complete len:282 (-) Transcript_104835:109-954(-)